VARRANTYSTSSSGDQSDCKTLKVAGEETGHIGVARATKLAPTGGKTPSNFVTVDDVGRQAGRKGTLKEPPEVIPNTWLKIPWSKEA